MGVSSPPQGRPAAARLRPGYKHTVYQPPPSPAASFGLPRGVPDGTGLGPVPGSGAGGPVPSPLRLASPSPGAGGDGWLAVAGGD